MFNNFFCLYFALEKLIFLFFYYFSMFSNEQIIGIWIFRYLHKWRYLSDTFRSRVIIYLKCATRTELSRHNAYTKIFPTQMWLELGDEPKTTMTLCTWNASTKHLLACLPKSFLRLWNHVDIKWIKKNN